MNISTREELPSTTARARTIPTASGSWLLGSLQDLQRDPLGLLQRATAECGDMVRIRFGAADAILVNHPDHVEHVLVTRVSNYPRNRAFRRSMNIILGNSLLVSDGDVWRKHRRSINPVFHRTKMNEFAGIMADASDRLIQRWKQRSAPGGLLDVSAEMSRLTIDIVGRTLFGAAIDKHADDIIALESEAARDVYIKMRLPFQAPRFLPTPANRRLKRCRRAFEAIARPVLEAARRDPESHTLAAMLLAARDDEDGRGMSSTQIYDELIGFVLGGHETSANVLTWTLYFLAQHPEWVRQLLAEYDSVLGTRRPALDDLPRLVLNRCVLNESMRLRPPAWLIPRTAAADDTIAGFHIKAGQNVWISPWVLHRHPGVWEQPERFDPQRFASERMKQRPRHAFAPFGAGQKMCIGSGFAMMEMELVLPELVRYFQYRLPANAQVHADPYVTLRPRGGLPMHVEARA
jgi:cytochrome P450